ncbi:MAG: type II toxin-antitoxin system ParD family antitoxin [Planctomycetota bacterium]
MNISLTPKLKRYVEEKLESGDYRSASEVIREGLRLLLERDRIRNLRLEELRSEIKIGLDELDRGEGIPGDVVFEEIRERLAKRKREGK